ncbi:hypothetical protein ROZALSC1DRAFT_16144 [Rozella allomycis CSF55]|uniref:Uncharacterized protein n=1 Tax=Rozella allomycis (strain CSF55) TaxID=988480 RepID=A0A4P9YEM3_ROZAC|nr:hypothetical protein ROZALSC1DRAFT_16144 [Rozella allomycis CSF55]
MLIASKGHFFTHIPQPIHRVSDIKDIFDLGVTSIHCLPLLPHKTYLLHSCRHFWGLHLSSLTIAIRVSLSDISRKNH